MAVINLGSRRVGRAAKVRTGKTVDVASGASGLGTAADTLDLNALGFNRVDEVWLKVPNSAITRTAQGQVLTLGAALGANVTYRFIGK